MRHRFLTVLVLLAVAMPLSAQDYAFESLTVEDGLSQSSVLCLAQDEKGFLWIGTRDGLNLYNGKDVKVFRKIPFDTNSLQSNSINSLLIDGAHGIYVGTTVGLQRYNQASGQFELIRLTKDGEPQEIRSLYRDQFDFIWAATDNGFYRIEHKREEHLFVVSPYFNFNNDEERDSLRVRVYAFLHDKNKDFWITTSRGVIRFLYKNSALPTLTPDMKELVKSEDQIIGIQQNSAGEVFGYGDGNLLLFSPEQNTFSTKIETHVSVGGLQAGQIRNGRLWAPGNSGIRFISLDDQSNFAVQEITMPVMGLSQSRHRLNFILQDNIYEDFYWLATDLGGVIKMYKRKKNFHTTLLKDIPNLDVRNPYLRHIVAQGDNIWLNLGHGVILYQRKKNSFQFITDLFMPGDRVSSTSVSSLHKHQDGKVYATMTGGMTSLEVDENENVRAIKHTIKQNQLTDCNAFTETKNHFITGGRTGHVSIIEKNGLQEVFNFQTSFTDKSFTQSEITSLLLDDQSNLWVGTSHGLIIYPNFISGYTKLPKPVIIQYNYEDTTSLIDNRVTDILQDSKGVIWVCTRNGLMTATLINGKAKLNRTNIPDLQNKVLYGLIEDKNKYQFWLSSNNGLYRFDPITRRIDNYDFNDGLQGNEFNSFSFYQAASGEILFGGTNGFTSFFPEEIQAHTSSPPIWITDLTTTDNQRYNLLTRDTSTILNLDFSQRSFSINFIGLNYLESEDQNYFYSLGGAAALTDVALGESQQVNFSQLDPGSYTFQIHSVNKNGFAETKSDTLNFVIRTPFWRMPWFYLLMTGLVAFLGWLLFYLRYQNKIRQLRAIDQIRKNISEDFHDELGSKLSIISMYSEFTKQELNKENSKAPQYLDKVNDTASRLYENTRDLIWALNPRNDSLYELFLQLKDFGEEMFQDTTIEFRSAGLAESWKDKNLPMRYKRHLLLIFKEGMHNALKHSNCKTIKLSIDEKDQKLIIMLQDDGIGFDSTASHKGDGLKNMAHRAEQLHGGIHFISKKEGTRIWVEVPFDILNNKK